MEATNTDFGFGDDVLDVDFDFVEFLTILVEHASVVIIVAIVEYGAVLFHP